MTDTNESADPADAEAQERYWQLEERRRELQCKRDFLLREMDVNLKMLLCDWFELEADWATFRREQVGRTFKVFRPEWVLNALDENIQPLFGKGWMNNG